MIRPGSIDCSILLLLEEDGGAAALPPQPSAPALSDMTNRSARFAETGGESERTEVAARVHVQRAQTEGFWMNRPTDECGVMAAEGGGGGGGGREKRGMRELAEGEEEKGSIFPAPHSIRKLGDSECSGSANNYVLIQRHQEQGCTHVCRMWTVQHQSMQRCAPRLDTANRDAARAQRSLKMAPRVLWIYPSPSLLSFLLLFYAPWPCRALRNYPENEGWYPGSGEGGGVRLMPLWTGSLRGGDRVTETPAKCSARF
ncbi:hypothetical protein D4764_15G0000740 [Takifugu flavidus]|uniref:Uncharacterized protein n=1 Tax=Takifugu flavidus TaxID=433684 RepID=A0A5C6P3B6_9TELE|nr:hypothetical protein D4764_15G0000740 [Takifugu flavidus]